MEQTSNACVNMECGEQDKTCDTSPGKGKPPTQEDLDQLHQNNNNNNNTIIVDIQKEMGSTTPAGKEVGDQNLKQTPKIQEDIAELCLPQDDNPSLGDDSIPELLPLGDDQEKMEQDTENQVAEYPREQEMAFDDHPMEGERPTQVQIGNHNDFSISGPNNTKETSGAEDLEVLEQPPKVTEDIAEPCLPQEDNPFLQDDFIEEEEKLSLPTSLSSQDDEVTPQPPPDDEGDNISSPKKELSCGEEEEGMVSQPTSLSSKDVQRQAIVYNDESQKIRKRSIETEVKSFDNEYLNHSTEYESLKAVIDSLQNKYSKLFKAYRKQCVKFVNYRYESDQVRQSMENDIAKLWGELNSLKAKLPPVEE